LKFAVLVAPSARPRRNTKQPVVLGVFHVLAEEDAASILAGLGVIAVAEPPLPPAT
jgi:hypothetical protein